MSSLFGGKSKQQQPVAPAAPAMPDTESPEVQEAKRRSSEALMQRAGRASTILTAPGSRGSDSPSVGADTYANRTLGGV